MWLQGHIPEEWRPDKVHLYATGAPDDETLKVRVDCDWEWSWKGSPVVEHLRASGKHVLIVVGDQVTFLAGHGRTRPEKIMLEWTL
jgi:hypothetical protein